MLNHGISGKNWYSDFRDSICLESDSPLRNWCLYFLKNFLLLWILFSVHENLYELLGPVSLHLRETLAADLTWSMILPYAVFALQCGFSLNGHLKFSSRVSLKRSQCVWMLCLLSRTFSVWFFLLLVFLNAFLL